ncbi:MAG: hypothetical protein O3B47_03100 [bacterium]|nr:hypothetical protein [bacterium]
MEAKHQRPLSTEPTQDKTMELLRGMPEEARKDPTAIQAAMNMATQIAAASIAIRNPPKNQKLRT